jgi:hypothetical protein
MSLCSTCVIRDSQLTADPSFATRDLSTHKKAVFLVATKTLLKIV